jgi:hypothetical protein
MSHRPAALVSGFPARCMLFAAGLLCCCLCSIAAAQENAAMAPKTTVEMQKDAEGHDIVLVTWKTRSGADIGQVRTRVSGLGRIGPMSTLADGATPNENEWDTREWQWWKNYPFEPQQMRPRELAYAAGGAEPIPGGVRVWTRFICDEVETAQEWFFMDLEDQAPIAYDCLITVRNRGKDVLDEYGQFFASYTSWNGQHGHFYWNEDGALVNYRDRGGRHLDYYVTAKDSAFAKLGVIPGCPRNNGQIKALWKHPVSVSQPGPDGRRHVLMSEEARTSAITMGMNGVAQDYLIYPAEGRLAPGAAFDVHIRHVIARPPEDDLIQSLETWWAEFTKDHQRVRGMTKFRE